jgi:hypothetical protein
MSFVDIRVLVFQFWKMHLSTKSKEKMRDANQFIFTESRVYIELIFSFVAFFSYSKDIAISEINYMMDFRKSQNKTLFLSFCPG